ncbi:hypothetical protein BWK60_13700, partial [Flavobacterium covae]
LLFFLITICFSQQSKRNLVSENKSFIINFINTNDTITTQKSLNLEWLKLDLENLNNIISIANNKKALENDSFFKKSIINFDLRDTKDLGFGLTLIDGAQYGGYVTTWVKALTYKNKIIQYEFSYTINDFEIVNYLIKNNTDLKSKIILKQTDVAPYSLNYINELSYQNFTNKAKKKLGKINLKIDNTNEKLKAAYNLLTDPINTYDFGKYCYEGSSQPEGYKAINYLISSNNLNIIKEIIKGYNPEGRLYAIEAILVAASENKIVLTNEDKALIKKILKLNILIKKCDGCKVFKTYVGEILDSKLKKLIE